MTDYDPLAVKAIKDAHGCSWGEACRLAGITGIDPDSVRRRYNAVTQDRHKPRAASWENTCEKLLANHIAENIKSPRITMADEDQARNTRRQIVRAFETSALESETDDDTLWRLVIERQQKYHKPRAPRNHVELDLGQGYIGLTHFTDLHTGDRSCDYYAMKRDAETVRDTPNYYCTFGGDAMNNFVTRKLVQAAAQDAPLQEQWDIFAAWTRIIHKSTLVWTAGNHDNWSYTMAGVDRLGEHAKALRILYDPHEYVVDVKVGSQKYRMIVIHTYRGKSMYHDCHGLVRYYRERKRYDVAFAGHTHTAAAEWFAHDDGYSWAILANTYKLRDHYGEGLHFRPTNQPLMPGVILSPDKHEIQVCQNPTALARYLRYLNSEHAR